MPRRVRLEYPGAVYHVMSRGDRGEPIFISDRDRHSFLETLEQACARSGFLVHAYVLMPNHYHVLLETPEGNLVEGMRWLQGTYTIRFNFRNGLAGHVFQGRYKAIPLDPAEPDYFRTVSDYIHLNPARARLLKKPNQALGAYPWSSFPAYTSAKTLPPWLVRSRVFESLGLKNEKGAARRWYKQYLETVAHGVLTNATAAEMDNLWQDIRRGWYMGGESFRDRLEEVAEHAIRGKRRASFEPAGLSGHDERVAQAMLQKVMDALALDAEALKMLRPSDPLKQGVIWFLRSHTTASAAWLNHTLRAGHPSNVSRAMTAYLNPEDPGRKKIKKAILQACKD